MASLPRLTALDDTYAVGRALEEPDAFGIFYRGWNVTTEEQVLIREYFPRDVAQREGETSVAPEDNDLFRYGLEQFLEESTALQQLDHENVLNELTCIETHHTAYRVFEHEEGAALRTGLENKGALSEQAARTILGPVLEGLERIHKKGLVHGGISPDALFLAKSGHPLVRHVRNADLHVARRAQQLPAMLSPEYAAPEQYLADSEVGPWMDVYGCGAVLYHMLSGEAPPSVKNRLQDDEVPGRLEHLQGLSAGLRRALRQALALTASERPSSVAALRDLLDDPPEEDASHHETRGKETAAPESSQEEALSSTSSEPPDDASSAGEDAAAKTDEPEDSPVASSRSSTAEAEEATAMEAGEEPVSDEEARHEAPLSPAPDRRAQEPDEHGEGREDEEASRRTPLYAGTALLLIVLMGGGVFFMMGDEPAQARPAQAVLLKRQGDSLYERHQFKAAKASYEEALAEKPGDPYAERRIAEAQTQLRKINERQYYTRLADGDSLLKIGAKRVAAGDSARGRKALEQANTKYLKALNNKPNDSLALARVQKVTQRLFSKEKAQAADEEKAGEEASSQQDQGEAFRTQMFSYLRDEAKRLFEEGEYAASRRRFKEALDIQDDQFAREKIAEIDELMTQRKASKRYDQHMAQGQQYLGENDLKAAQAAFEKALNMKPNDSTAQRRLDQVKTQLTKKRDHEKYQNFRVQGTEQMKQGDYQAAVQSFQQALQYKPNDSYTEEQIAEAKKKMAEAEKQREEQAEASRVDENGIYKRADHPPSLIGSLQDLYNKAQYPQRAKEHEIEGKVFVRFVVNERGHVTRSEIVPGHGLGYGTDEEARRIIEEMRFEPGTVDGEPVKAWHTMMVRFQSDDF